MAPACPILFPAGAVCPAMYDITGLETWFLIYYAASSAAVPTISPTITIALVFSSYSNIFTISMNDEPGIGSPPIPTQLLWPSPRSVDFLNCA